MGFGPAGVAFPAEGGAAVVLVFGPARDGASSLCLAAVAELPVRNLMSDTKCHQPSLVLCFDPMVEVFPRREEKVK